MRVLGLAFSGHGTAACLVEDGAIVRAVNLERLTRTKFSIATVPEQAELVAGILKKEHELSVAPKIFDFYEVFPRLLRYLTGEESLERAGIDLVVKTQDNIRSSHGLEANDAHYLRFLRFFGKTPVHFELEHHLAHAYQAYLSSPFEETAILTIDGTGERLARLGGQSLSTTFGVGKQQRVEVFHEIRAPASIGGLYSFVTHHLGFREEQEGNTMALAAFGTDAFHRTVRDQVRVFESGDFDFVVRPTLDGFEWFEAMKKFRGRREHGAPIEQDHKDIAYACQASAEAVIINAARAIHRRTGSTRLAVAGGVALNCVANAKILEQTPIAELYVMPNAGDRGLSAGCALFGYHVVLGGRERKPRRNDYLGREYSRSEIASALNAASGIEFREEQDIAAEVASLLASGKIVGWVQGGAEFGPRALGHRSILADPRTAESKRRLDHEIKRREWFRPYAPSVLREHAARYFELDGESPYMLLAVQTRAEVRDEVAGIVHVDGTARVQTVDAAEEPLYCRLIEQFRRRTGVPLVLNTSFNGYGEPMVETPEDALQALPWMNLDALAIGNYLVTPHR
jgi:carbamoyltransferase